MPSASRSQPSESRQHSCIFPGTISSWTGTWRGGGGGECGGGGGGGGAAAAGEAEHPTVSELLQSSTAAGTRDVSIVSQCWNHKCSHYLCLNHYLCSHYLCLSPLSLLEPHVSPPSLLEPYNDVPTISAWTTYVSTFSTGTTMSPLSLLEPEMSPQHLPQTIVCYNHALARRTAQCVATACP